MIYYRTRDGVEATEAEAMQSGALRPGYGVRTPGLMLMDAARSPPTALFLDALPSGLPAVLCDDVQRLADALVRPVGAGDAASLGDAIRTAYRRCATHARQMRFDAAGGRLTPAGAREAEAEALACDAACGWLDRAAAAVRGLPPSGAQLAAGERDAARREAARDHYIDTLTRRAGA